MGTLLLVLLLLAVFALVIWEINRGAAPAPGPYDWAQDQELAWTLNVQERYDNLYQREEEWRWPRR